MRRASFKNLLQSVVKHTGVLFLIYTIMIWVYLIALILYIIGFIFRSCLYETVSGYSKDIPLARNSPKLRKRVKTPRYYLVYFIFAFLIPVANVFVGFLCIAWSLPGDNQFLYFLNSKISKLLTKYTTF